MICGLFCFGACGVGRDHLSHSAVLSPREDVCYRVSPFVFVSCFAQGHKRRRSARHTLNAGVTKAGQPHANRIPLLYPCYTLTPLCVCLLQDDFIIRSFFVSDTIRNFLIPRGACLKSFAEFGWGAALGFAEESVEMAEGVEAAGETNLGNRVLCRQ